ncbi:MAG TPA: tetratricopeptide repeat-containing sensor histidine kinase [Puia sp.]|jgi:signal transduction histidine kinase|nr:tetratricopeptide repeat-containing sensor histidine kinase [Puia sp.]
MKSFCVVAWMVVFLAGATERSPAQSGEVARLHSSLRGLGEGNLTDSAYVDTLNRLVHLFYGINSDSAFHYAHMALDYAARIHYRKGEAESWRMLGNTFEMVGDYLNMLSCYQHSLDIAEEIGNPNLIGKANVNIALFYKQEGEFDQAQELMQKVQDLYKANGDSVQSAYISSYLADLAFRQHQYELALQYAGRALEAARSIRDAPTIATFNNDFGRILAATGNYPAALDHHLQSLIYYRGVDDWLGTTSTNSLLAQDYLLLKDYPQALKYANEALAEARAIRRKLEAQGSAKVLADIYEAKGDYRNALKYYQLYKEYSDSLFNDQSSKQIYARAAQYDYERQEARLREAQALKDAGYERALRRDDLKISITAFVIVLLSLLAFILWRERAVNRRVNRLLHEKNDKIEEQKEILEQQAVQLLLSNQQKDKLFSIIAHDLRGPLNSLKGLMDFRKEKKLTDVEINQMMRELRSHVDSSSEMVGNLLYWASSQLNGMKVIPVLLPMDELVEEVLHLYGPQAIGKKVLLSNRVPPSVVGYGDKDMIRAVIRNLVSNAIKFCHSGGVVLVDGCKRGGEIEICITDTGTGMSEDALDRIRRKESFSNYGTASEKGTGLGILLCHEFAEANKGRFYAESEWGKGSRCYFTIPAAPSSSSISV